MVICMCISCTHRAWQENNPSVCQISPIFQKGIFCVCGFPVSHLFNQSCSYKPTWVVCVQCRLVGECSVGRTEDSPGQHAVFWGVSAGQNVPQHFGKCSKNHENYISVCVRELYAQEGNQVKLTPKFSFLAHARVQTANLIYLFNLFFLFIWGGSRGHIRN